jgi:phytoene dehydrogenase-like protein
MRDNRPMQNHDVVVVGAGPNGLAAAAHMTRAGNRVLVVEQADEIGGGTRTDALTLPGFLHDVCSAIHPLGFSSPFFGEIGLDVEWIHPEIPVSHPLGGGRGAALFRDLGKTTDRFGTDADHYRKVIGPLAETADQIVEDYLGPIWLPRHPGSFVRMAARGALPASRIINGFNTDEPRAVLAGMAAHAIAPLGSPLTGGVALLFAATAHAYGWPMVKGGSQRIAEALATIVVDGGGSVETGHMVESLDEFNGVSVFLLDVMPGAALSMAGNRVKPMARHRLTGRQPGPAVFKVDWALDGPIPWSDELSRRAGTVHVGGTFEEVKASEDAVTSGRHPDQPFVLLSQQTQFDPSRAPADKHTAWGYCHVPQGSERDMTGAIEAQIERFAPGFRDLILARHTFDADGYESHNPNYVGGDIAGGRFGFRKVFQVGPTMPYRIGDGVYLCSSATPPGAGVHGMCGFHAAEAALDDMS